MGTKLSSCWPHHTTLPPLDSGTLEQMRASQHPIERMLYIIKCYHGRLPLRASAIPTASVDTWLCFSHAKNINVWRCQEHAVEEGTNGLLRSQLTNRYTVDMTRSLLDGDLWLISIDNDRELRLTFDSDLLHNAPDDSLLVFYYSHHRTFDLTTRVVLPPPNVMAAKGSMV